MKRLEKIWMPEEDDEIHLVQRYQDLRRLLSMDPHIHIVDRVHGVLIAFEKFMEDRCLVKRFRPNGKWGKVMVKAVGGCMQKGIKQLALKNHV